MTIDPFTQNDLYKLAALQPDGWNDITPSFSFYLDSPFCFPVKADLNNNMVGVGCAIMFNNTAWLAHIIVHPDFRNRGIGLALVRYLVNYLENLSCSTILLLATQLGEPVYKKAGFITDTEYIFFHEGGAITKNGLPDEIIYYSDKYKSDILSLDRKVTGEDRLNILNSSLNGSYLYIENNKLKGFYLPSLGEGLIIADDKKAGLALMNFKYSGITKAVLPSDNHAGVDFLLNNNFKEKQRGRRMWLGKKIEWHPEMLYSRIGGHVG